MGMKIRIYLPFRKRLSKPGPTKHTVTTRDHTVQPQVKGNGAYENKTKPVLKAPSKQIAESGRITINTDDTTEKNSTRAISTPDDDKLPRPKAYENNADQDEYKVNMNEDKITADNVPNDRDHDDAVTENKVTSIKTPEAEGEAPRLKINGEAEATTDSFTESDADSQVDKAAKRNSGDTHTTDGKEDPDVKHTNLDAQEVDETNRANNTKAIIPEGKKELHPKHTTNAVLTHKTADEIPKKDADQEVVTEGSTTPEMIETPKPKVHENHEDLEENEVNMKQDIKAVKVQKEASKPNVEATPAAEDEGKDVKHPHETKEDDTKEMNTNYNDSETIAINSIFILEDTKGAACEVLKDLTTLAALIPDSKEELKPEHATKSEIRICQVTKCIEDLPIPKVYENAKNNNEAETKREENSTKVAEVRSVIIDISEKYEVEIIPKADSTRHSSNEADKERTVVEASKSNTGAAQTAEGTDEAATKHTCKTKDDKVKVNTKIPSTDEENKVSSIKTPEEDKRTKYKDSEYTGILILEDTKEAVTKCIEDQTTLSALILEDMKELKTEQATKLETSTSQEVYETSVANNNKVVLSPKAKFDTTKIGAETEDSYTPGIFEIPRPEVYENPVHDNVAVTGRKEISSKVAERDNFIPEISEESKAGKITKAELTRHSSSEADNERAVDEASPNPECIKRVKVEQVTKPETSNGQGVDETSMANDKAILSPKPGADISKKEVDNWIVTGDSPTPEILKPEVDENLAELDDHEGTMNEAIKDAEAKVPNGRNEISTNLPEVNKKETTKLECNMNVNREYGEKNPKEVEKLHRNFHKFRLLQSGDIETEPGPNTQRKKMNTQILTMTIRLMFLIIIVNRMKNHPEMKPTQKPTTQTLDINMISHLLAAKLNRNNRTLSPTQADLKYLAILLILSGDIKLNPGPPEENEKQSCCKLGHKTNTHITCDNCGQESCLECIYQSNKTTHKKEKSFEWVCSNHLCRPNHYPGIPENNHETTNQYQSLANKNEQPEAEKTKKLKKRRLNTQEKKQTPKDHHSHGIHDENYHLLKELTRITPAAYIGKEYCRSCHKTVGANERAISCDLCKRWTHLKCSDMATKTYNQNKNKEFPWVCNTCRTPEVLHKDKLDIRKLTKDQIPITNESLQERNPNKFLLLHYNCRSYLSKFEEIQNICYKLQPAILCLTETWLDSSTGPQAYIPQGYAIIRQDRTEEFKQKYGKTNGGGVAILHKKELKVRKIINNANLEETLWVQVKSKPNFTLGVVYRAEYTDLLTDNGNGTIMEAQLREATSKTNKLIVVGDFNCDTESNTPDTKTNILSEVFETQGMIQTIKQPTRIEMNSNKATTIDHIWTRSESNLISNCGTVEGISDHTGLFAIINTAKAKPEQEKIKYRCYKNYSEENFNNDLKKALEDPQLIELIEQKQINSATEKWMKIFLDTAEIHAPVKEITINTVKKKQVPWFTKDLEQLMMEKTKRLQLYRLDGLFSDKQIVKTLSNKITHLKRKLKSIFYRDKIQEHNGDSKKMWKILKEVTQTEKRLQYVEPEFLDQNLADNFNTYFATIGTKIQEKLNIKEKTTPSNNTERFNWTPESEESIKKLIDRIRTDVAVGYDNISARLLKDTKHTIADSLTKLVNISYEKSTFPNCLKKAIVRAIHKKDNTEDASNYRPLSILSVVSKIFERSATNQLIAYLERNQLLNETQHAYRKNHSTHTCLGEVLNYIYQEHDKGNLVGMASLDLSKAFDTINHSHLIHKLNKLGLGKNSLNWCESYLSNRKQKTKFKKYMSEETTVTAGVPQGSILGPVLFICFTNDLPDKLKNCKIISYADDSQILVSGKSSKDIKQLLESLISSAQTWYTENSLLINASKSEVMIINRRKKDGDINIEVTEDGKKKRLKLQENIKILGIYIDKELNWNKQVKEINKKANYAAINLNRVNQLVPKKERLILYNSLVAPHLNYADTVWGGCGSKNTNKLQRTQNAAVKSMLGRKKQDSATEALKTANLLPLEEKRRIHEAVYAHKALKGNLPTAICRQYQQQQSQMNNRSTARQVLTIPIHRTELYKKSPLYRTIKTWNSIPDDIKHTETTTSFRKKFQSHLLNTFKT